MRDLIECAARKNPAGVKADRQPERPRVQPRVGQDQPMRNRVVKPASTSIGSVNWSKE